MGFYEDFVKRTEYNSRSNLKDRAFKRRVEKDYNSEVIYLLEDMESPISAIIQTSRLQDRYDYKKISLPFTTNIKTGDIIYWERDLTNWLIYLQRNTEKNYFLGEMKEANHKISWKDKNGVVYSQLGCFTKNTLSTEMLQQVDYFDYLEAGAQLLLTKTKDAENLKLYDKFIVGSEVWKVVGVDSITYKNIIVYSLKLTEWNKDEDSKDLPYGKINNIFTIEENSFQLLTEIRINDRLELNPITKINGKPVEDTYKIETINCTLLDNNLIDFDTMGKAEIIITSEKTKAVKNHTIIVKENPDVQDNYFITGPDKIKATLSYEYKINRAINGRPVLVAGEWLIEDNDIVKISEKSSSSCILKAGKYSGNTSLSYKLDSGEIVAKINIEVKNMFE